MCSVYKFFNNSCPNYFDEIYFPTESKGVQTRSAHQKLKVPHRKTTIGQRALSYIGPSLWNNLNMKLKSSTNLNAFKHNIKEHYFNELKKKET